MNKIIFFTPYLDAIIYKNIGLRKNFKLDSKTLYHNGRLGVSTDFAKICDKIKSMSKVPVRFNKVDDFSMWVNFGSGIEKDTRTSFNLWKEAECKVSTENRDLVYLIRAGGHVKIGKANDVGSRLKQLQTGNPIPLEILTTYTPTKIITHDLEKKLHEHFRKHNTIGEWFVFDFSVESFIESCNNLDC